MAFRWRADNGPLLVVFVSTLQLLKITIQQRQSCVGPPLTKLSRSAHANKSANAIYSGAYCIVRRTANVRLRLAQSRLNLYCSYTQIAKFDEGSDQILDDWANWTASGGRSLDFGLSLLLFTSIRCE